LTPFSCGVYKFEVCKGKIENLEFQNTYLKTNRFEGVIFSKDYDPFGLNNGSGNKFTPTISEIDSAEIILRNGIEEINSNRPNQFGNCPVIHENLGRYKRQYFGITENGDKIIFINCFWDRRNRFNKNPIDTIWKTQFRSVFDGCSYYWSIKVNLTKKFLFDFGVNGVA
jgi:hypothetical protein